MKRIRIYNKDCRDMCELPDESVQGVVTSPPYWGLRKYKGDQDLIWGGDKSCNHDWIEEVRIRDNRYTAGLSKNFDTLSGAGGKFGMKESFITNTCSLCGAWSGSYGLEPTPEMYIEHTIEILREIRRVLRKDGVVFWNVGDSYWGGKGQSGQGSPEYQANRQGISLNKPYHQIGGQKQTRPSDGRHSYIKPKDLCLIPFRVAIAAQSDGWWVRSVIIWSKPNPMPESVKDRPTRAHEYILMLTKSAKYYWDMELVKEESACGYKSNLGVPTSATRTSMNKTNEYKISRNIRSVWEFPTKGFSGAHFAVFPEKLPELCIKAATSDEGCCSKCGSPYERIVKRTRLTRPELSKDDPRYWPSTYNGAYGDINGKGDAGYTVTETLGWRPTCKCNASKSQSVVLDPFMGSGTTLCVARRLGRYSVGYELSKEYCDLAIERLNGIKNGKRKRTE